jgi:hypothetical protein
MSLSQIEGDMGLIRRTDLCCEKSVHWETRELSWAKGLIAIRTGLGQDFPMLLALSFAPHIQYLCPPAVRQTANPSRMRTMSMYTINHHCLVRIKSALQPVPNKEIQDSFWKQWDSMQQSIHFTPCPPVRWTVPAHCLPICTAAILHSAAVLISVSSLSAHTFPRVQHPTDPGSRKHNMVSRLKDPGLDRKTQNTLDTAQRQHWEEPRAVGLPIGPLIDLTRQMPSSALPPSTAWLQQCVLPSRIKPYPPFSYFFTIPVPLMQPASPNVVWRFDSTAR